MSLASLRSSTVGDWQACGDCFYSRELLHDMVWEDIDLDTKRVCMAPFGGPIATMRDEQAMVMVTSSQSVQPVVRIFTAAGTALGSFLWESQSRLVDWCWSHGLQLVVMEDSGLLSLRSLQGQKLREMSLGSAVQAQGVAAAAMWGGGAAVLTQAGEVWVTQAWAAEGRPPLKLATPPLGSEAVLTCKMAVMQPQHTLSGGVEVLLGRGTSIWQLDEVSCVEHSLPHKGGAALALMKLSPDGAFLAVYTVDGRLLVMSADLSRQLSQFETRTDSPPSSLDWCGSDAVVLQWPELLLVVGPYGDHASWATPDEKVVLSSEVDGVRLLSNSRHELLRKVPPALAEVFRPGSTSPATQLWDAREMLDAGQPRADKALRLLGSELQDAVMSCVEAAGHDLAVARQKALLRAAAYGRAFCGTSFPPHHVHNTCHRLRLLNCLREQGVGMPLTMLQLEVLGVQAVVARLVALQHWLLAFRIAASLRHAHASLLLPPTSPSSAATAMAPMVKAAAGDSPLGLGISRSGATASLGAQGLSSTEALLGSAAAVSSALQVAVVSAWARAKISAVASGQGQGGSVLGDQELKEVLMAKLSGCSGVRYAPLAAHAQALGRRRLALALLDEESSCALQVPLLLDMASTWWQGPRQPGARADEEGGERGEDPLVRALRRAIESGDTDLVYLVLFSSYRQRPLQDFWQLVSSRTLAKNLFFKYCRAKEPELLETLLATTGQTVELADLQVSRALAAWADAHQAGRAGETALTQLTHALTEASHKYATSRDHSFMSKAMADQAALRREQARLEKEMEAQQTLLQLTGTSLATTLQLLLRHGNMRAATSLKKQFAVGDKHFCWLRIRTLCEVRDWDALEVMAAERKQHPAGWEPFVEQARKHGARRDVLSRLVSRMPDSAVKAEEYANLDMPREAAEVAARLRDTALFTRIAGAVSAGSPAALAVAQIKERFLGPG